MLGRMTLSTTRFNKSGGTPIFFEVDHQLPSAPVLLLHLTKLPGLKVISKKSWALTDDFQAFFTYGGCLFLMDTDMVNIEILILGEPSDERLSNEVETHIQNFNNWSHVLFPVAFAKFLFLPFNPPKSLLIQHKVSIKSP